MYQSLEREKSMVFPQDFSEHTVLAVAHSRNCIAALKKQLPNSTVCNTDEDSRTCGGCGSDIDMFINDDYEFCPYCGQKL